MKKMIINSAQAEKLDSFCNQLNINSDYVTDETPLINAEKIMSMLEYGNNIFKENVNRIEPLPIEDLNDLRTNNIADLTDISIVLSEIAKVINKAISDIVAHYKAQTTQGDFTMLRDDEYLKKLVRNQENRRIRYMYGEFLLELFSSDKGVSGRPFLVEPIASGNKEAGIAVAEYIDRLL